MAKVKGNLVYHTREYYKQVMGEVKFDEMMERLSPETQIVLTGIITSGDMYDLCHYKELLEEFYKEAGKEKLIAVAELLGEIQLKGFFGLSLSLVNFESVMKKGPSLWNKMFDDGELEISYRKEGEATIIIRDFDYNEALMIGIAYYIRRWMELLLDKPVYVNYRRGGENIIKLEYTY